MIAAMSATALRPAAPFVSQARRASRSSRLAAVVPRASAQQEDQITAAPTEAAPSSPVPTPKPAAPKTPSFGEVMAFNGAPEIANGRLAMLGFLAAVGAELATGESIFQQFAAQPAWILYTFVLFIGASLIPVFKNTKREAFGFFRPEAELLNGRAAMIGFAAMLAIEAVRGAALF